MIITEDWLKEKNACNEGLEWFKNRKQIEHEKIVEALMGEDKFDWANWLITRMMDKPQRVSYAIFAAEQVIEIFEKKYPVDKRPRNAIEAAKKWLSHNSDKNRADAAYAAAADAYAAAADAYAAYTAADAYAAYTAADAAYIASYTAADAVADAADDARNAATATGDATVDADSYAAAAAATATAAAAAATAADDDDAADDDAASYAATAAAAAAYADDADAARKKMRTIIINYGLELLTIEVI